MEASEPRSDDVRGLWVRALTLSRTLGGAMTRLSCNFYTKDVWDYPQEPLWMYTVVILTV